MHKVQVTPLIGLPRFDGWAQVMTSASGSAVWALAVSGQHARNVGRDIADTISETHLSSSADMYALVQKIVNDTHAKAADIACSCGLILDDVTTFCAYQGSITLKRNEKVAPLVQAQDAIKIIEGKRHPEDVLIFATQQAAQFMGEVEQKLIQGYEVDTIVTSITPSLHLEEATALSALGFVKQIPVAAAVDHVSTDQETVSQSSPNHQTPFDQNSQTTYQPQQRVTYQGSFAIAGSDTEDGDITDVPFAEYRQHHTLQDNTEREYEPEPSQISAHDTPHQTTAPEMTPVAGPHIDTSDEAISSMFAPDQPVQSSHGEFDHSKTPDETVAARQVVDEVLGRFELEKETARDSTPADSVSVARERVEKQPSEQQFTVLLQRFLSQVKVVMSAVGSTIKNVPIQSILENLRSVSLSFKKHQAEPVATAYVSSQLKEAQTESESEYPDQLPSFASATPKGSSIGRPVYIGGSSSRKILRVVLPVLLIGGLVFGGGGYVLYTRNQSISQIETVLEPIQTTLVSAREKSGDQPIIAREEVATAIEDLKNLQEQYQQQRFAIGRVDATLSEAEELFESISGKEEFSELPVFFNTREGDLDMVVTESAVYGKFAVFYDAQKDILVRLDLETKEAQSFDFVVRAESEEAEESASSRGVSSVTIREFDESVWLLGSSLLTFKPDSESELRTALTDSSAVTGGTVLKTYGDSFYIFNPAERTIFKLSPADEGFEDATRWLRSGLGTEFENIASMAIDGEIWLSTKDGQILRFAAGRQQDFEVSGLSEPFTGAIMLFTQEDLDQLYVLDPSNHRIVILNKDGQYLNQIVSGSLASASTLLVDQERKRALAISGSTVFEASLENSLAE